MRKSRLAVSLVALALLAGACGDDDDAGTTDTTAAPGGTTEETTGETTGETTAGSEAPSGEGGTIEVTSLWGGGEAEAFEAALAQFTADTGVNVTYTSQRTDYAVVLNNRIAQNDPPDVAIIPGIGFLRGFANDGVLTPLADLGIDDAFLESAYQPGLAEMGIQSGTVGDTAYALVAKLNSKSTVWYRPDEFTAGGYEVPASFEDWVALADTIKADGKVPLALGAGDSWTLTDWFENIYIRQAGVEAYDTLFSAEGDWTDPTVQAALDTMLTILTSDNVVGGTDGALSTLFVDGIGMVFSPDPQALMYYEGGFVGGIAVTDTNPDLVWDETIGFFPFPTVDGQGEDTITIGGDVMAAFTNEPGVAEFMQWMASEEGGKAWAAGGTIISPFAGVEPTDYPDPRTQAEAEHVASATTSRYDGADLLPAGMSDSMGAAVQTVFQDPGSAESTFEALNEEIAQAWEDEAG